MGEAGQDAATAPAELLEALRASGAEGLDPVRFRFLEALARRAEGQTGEARRVIDEKLIRAAIALGELCAEARSGNSDFPPPFGLSLSKPVANRPSTGSGRTDWWSSERTDGGVPRVGHDSPASPLAELLAHIRDHAVPEAPIHPLHTPVSTAPRGELKAVAYFQRSWSQMSVDQQLAEALGQVPDNAGPFNPQRLAVQALQRMRDTAPDYLRQLLAYLDGLIWLEQAAGTAKAPPKKAVPRRNR